MLSSNSFRLALMVAAAFSAVTSATGPVDLGTAEDYVILTKTGISTVPDSIITGYIGVSPIAAAAMTGFGLYKDSGGEFSTSSQLAGLAFASDYEEPTPYKLTTAVSDMETAYLDCKGRPEESGKVDFGAGNLGGDGYGDILSPLTAGVYTFGTDVNINANLHFSGNANDVFIIRTAGNLNQVENTQVILTGGALAENIFWQVAGLVDVGADAHMKGILLVKTSVLFKTESSLQGRVLAQTRCDLQKATIDGPAL
jgi:hypothetical protein